MLISLAIEHFKGIATRQHVDFAPLTLLFGANSAGKSTVLQALLYLHEMIERGSADVDRTELGGSALELGGFARLVHKHDVSRTIVLRAEFGTPGGLERFGRDLTEFPFPDLEDAVESAWLELTIRYVTMPAFQGPIVERAVIGVNGEAEPLVWVEVGASLREGEPLLARVNLGHPVLGSAEWRALDVEDIEGSDESRLTSPLLQVSQAWADVAIPEDELHAALQREGGGYGGGSAPGAGIGDGSGFGDGRALPVFALSRARLSALPSPHDPLRVIPWGDDTPENAAVAEQVRTFLEMVVLGTTAQLSAFLRDAQYIGPLRAVPPRGSLYESARRATSWADGLAAWDLLLADRLNLVEQANAWLHRLGTRCQVRVQQLFDRGADAEELSADHVDRTVRRLLLDTDVGSPVLPSEVGAGISQVVPVVVAAIDARSSLVLIEQPEIHVHPAVQVGLGDLLIEAVTRDGGRRRLLVETHSEHLILRLLRRIRETADNDLEDRAPAFTDDKLSVLYVESSPEGVRIRRLRVDERGEFVDRWPKGFFAERAAELF